MNARIDKEDLALILVFSLVFFAVSAFNLGFSRTPVNGWQPSGEAEVSFDLGVVQKIESIYVLLSGPNSVNFEIYKGQPGSWEYSASFSEDGYYVWRSIDIDAETRYVKLHFWGKTGRIHEIFMVNVDGAKISISDVRGEGEIVEDVTRLVDEQNSLAEIHPTFRSETYFDEIYFVRAADEYLNGLDPFEWTHPPLGKLIIASGIINFGFSPFGWRIMGVLFATLMVSTIYVFGKAMFENRVAASISAFLLTFEFLHFTMGRIATVDTYAIFFTVASTLCFYQNYRGIADEDYNFNWLWVFLGVVFFSLAFSVKWYPFYGLIGEIFLIVLFSAWTYLNSKEERKTRFKEFILKPAGILLLSLCIGGLVYLSTFIPYMNLGHNLHDVYDRQWSMYNYHAGLEATHPYSSQWWSWPLMTKPLWLYVVNLPNGKTSSITAMGNPAIWWVGSSFMLTILWRTFKNRDRTCLFILTIFLFQWIPYAFIRRVLFIYHFYTNVPIFILAVTYFLNEWWENKEGRIVTIAYLIATLIAFLLFYPLISGSPISEQIVNKFFRDWIF